MALHCNKCGFDNADSAKFCTNCGLDLTQPTYYYQVPPQNNEEVMSIGKYLLTFLLLSIPIVNIVLMIIWSVSKNTNKNLQNFTRALWLWTAIWVAIWIVILVFSWTSATYFFYNAWDTPMMDIPMMEAPWYDTFRQI